jgi:hypothetical protein
MRAGKAKPFRCRCALRATQEEPYTAKNAKIAKQIRIVFVEIDPLLRVLCELCG